MRQIMRQPALAALALAWPGLVNAEPVLVTSKELHAFVPGSTVNIDTPIGTILPVTYAGDGSFSAEAGKLSFFLGSDRDHGRWWIKGDKLCQHWENWFDAETTCLELRSEGQKLYWRRDDGKEGTATLSVKPATAQVAAAQRSNLGGPARSEAAMAEAPLVAPVQAAALAPPPATQAPVARTVSPKPASAPAIAAAPETAVVSPAVVAPPAVAGLPRSASPQLVKKPTPVSIEAYQARAAAAAETGDAGPRRHVPSLLFRVYGVDSDDVLNIRSGPSADHAVMATIPPGATGVRITGQCIDVWCQVSYKSVTGWANRRYLVEEAAYSETAAETSLRAR